jgi:hypothetical protein
VHNTRYAVTNPEGTFASGRAEDSVLFHKNLHKVQIFVKQLKKYHAAAGEMCRYQDQTSGLNAHRVHCLKK